MRKTYYYCYDMDGKKDWLRQSMEKLSAYLSKSPADTKCVFEELPEEYEDGVLNIIKDIDIVSAWSTRLARLFREKLGQPSPLLILCSENSRMAGLAKQQNENAVWGVAYDWLAFSYGGSDEYIIWHEMLHLLGADDCYDLSKNERGPNCDLPNCIMQYEVTMENVGKWPFLCNGNLQLIRN